MFDFQNLEVYKKAKAFHVLCREFLSTHRQEAYIKDQLSRASFSIPLNIAEGSGKFSKADRRKYFVTARGSVFECIAIIDILAGFGKVTEEELEILTRTADELSRMLYTMIRNLTDRKQSEV
ncbi:MAG TPA: four helix bundle protein [Bacteroidales bacterium]|nr:four helix bundle protein [Bacteroidales bacterium]HSA42455.1 four helix bundle protein [Bacteroidales bacterium]